MFVVFAILLTVLVRLTKPLCSAGTVPTAAAIVCVTDGWGPGRAVVLLWGKGALDGGRC